MTDVNDRGSAPLNVFTEAVESTLASASVFALADLRGVARNKLLSKVDADEVLKLPIDAIKFRELRTKHIEHWQKFKDKDFLDNADQYKIKHNVTDANLVVDYVGDENSNKECVHLIGHEPRRKAIVCVFRGSVTLSDWVEDAKIMLGRVPNPLSHVEGQTETVGIHLGFRNYIHGANKKMQISLSRSLKKVGTRMLGSGDEEGSSEQTPLCRMDLVLEQLRELKKRFPSYSIYVQGHSLGGALSLIATLAIASDPILSQLPPDSPPGLTPVTVIAVGNPKPGDGDFCRAMEYLERNKKLRCCVIHNTYDVVPMLATNVARLDSGFWHPGWRLLLHKNRSEWGRGNGIKSEHQEEELLSDRSTEAVEVGCCGFPTKRQRKDNKSPWNIPVGFNPIVAAKNMTQQRMNKHNHREYLERLLRQEDQLRKVQLNDFYETMWGDAEAPKAIANAPKADDDVVDDLQKV
jgi:hypothetical protein